MPTLIFAYHDGTEVQRVSAGAGLDAVHAIKDLNSIVLEAEAKLNLPKGTYDFYDQYGKIEDIQDLKRALTMAGSGECVVELREHRQFVKIRDLENTAKAHSARMDRIEASIRQAEIDTDAKIEATSQRLKGMISKIEKRLNEEMQPTIETLCRDRNQLQKDTRIILEKLGGINVQELRDMADRAMVLGEEVASALVRVDRIEKMWNVEKTRLGDSVSRTHQELKDLQRYMQGKIDVCINADVDLRREHQLNTERMEMTADDVRLLTEELHRLTQQCAGALEESEELRTGLGEVRDENQYLHKTTDLLNTRVGCIEGAATEKWQGFQAGVLYFRCWHSTAKGLDVQLSADRSNSTGRGLMAATGGVMNNDEGLSVAEGPCRRFGTPGEFASYYEVEIDEIRASQGSIGGIFVGVSIQSGNEIAKHPKHEFDGWLLGGNGKALIVRAGPGGSTKESETGDTEELPDTFKYFLADGSASDKMVRTAHSMLKTALPPRAKGECRDVLSSWSSQDLRMGDRIGVLFRCHRHGGGRLRVSINGDIRANHEFADAPTAEAVGFLTPVVRLAGTAKSARIIPGIVPPAHMLAD